MTFTTTSKFGAFSALTAALFAATPALAEMSATELAKLAQNPIGNLVGMPFQNNTNLNVEPDKRNQNILNIQPVIPISVSDEWNIITRTIVPVIPQPLPDGDLFSSSGRARVSYRSRTCRRTRSAPKAIWSSCAASVTVTGSRCWRSVEATTSRRRQRRGID